MVGHITGRNICSFKEQRESGGPLARSHADAISALDIPEEVDDTLPKACQLVNNEQVKSKTG